MSSPAFAHSYYSGSLFFQYPPQARPRDAEHLCFLGTVPTGEARHPFRVLLSFPYDARVAVGMYHADHLHPGVT